MTQVFSVANSCWQTIQNTLLGCALVVCLSFTSVHAAEVPGLEKMVLLNAREQPVDRFMEELFGKLGIPAKVDDDIIGSVNGDFRKTAGEVVTEIMSAFQLAVYYDGAVAHIYPANDIVRKMIYMPRSSAKNVKRTAEKLGLTDARNTLSTSDVGLIVTGADRFVERIERLSGAIRKKKLPPSTEKHDTYRIFKLKYAWADDVSLVIGGETVVVPGVASLIRRLIEPGALGNTPAISRSPATSSLEGLRGKGRSAQGLQAVDDGSDPPEFPAQEAGIQTPVGFSNEGTARTRIVADPLSNSVIIRDQADRMANYELLIKSLDKEPQMIEIEATIIDLDTDKMRALGINWRLQSGDSQALLGNGTASDDLLRPGVDVSPVGNGGVVSLILGSRQQFISRIRALETQGAARIVSKPHVMTLSNVEALLDTTSTFFVRVAGQEEVDLFDVKVGTRLRVTPHVYENGGRSQIKLRVNITDGSASDDQVDSIPIIEESNINTQAIVDVGQSLLIGGLVREIKADGVSRVPVLGRIPVLGGLFRTQTKTRSRQERMFLITPRLSSRHAAGKRFSAPVFSSDENTIIQSSALRLGGTQRALDQRDSTAYSHQAGDAIRPGSEIDTEQDKGRGTGSLRRRLQPDGAVSQPHANEILVNHQDGATDAQINAVVEQQGKGEWQVVGSPAVTVRIIEQPIESTTGSATHSPVVDEDGWQVISQ